MRTRLQARLPADKHGADSITSIVYNPAWMRARNLLGAATVILALAPSASGQPKDAPPGDTISTGRTEVGFLVAVASAMDVWGGLPDSEFLTLGVRLGRVLTNPIGPGSLRGNFLVSAEVNPVVVFHEDRNTTYAVSGALIFRHYFAPGSRFRPFFTFGGGVLFAADPIPHHLSRLNFTPQGGGGLAVALASGAVLSMEYRLHHMSNWLLSDPNPGANSCEFLFGVSWFP